ncbi:hypothetical protein BC941DRAFT_444155 [Chlamydoabsidia padenii]|nr:hypothetical protein BC941DRAFT_444155 [Chlamydoabsidia padenii]
MSTLPDCLKTSKCIIHVDLDCFYSQVEEVRLGLDSSKPVAVQQWTNLLAVNYPARAYGVSRMISAEEAKRLCPDITLVHVPTYAPNETEAKYHDNPSISTHKTSLDVYHTAGKKLFHIFKQHSGLLQKLGADEAFMDVTDQVNERLVQDYLPAHPALLDAHGLPVSQVGTFFLDWTSLNHVIPSSKEKERRDTDASYYDPVSWFDIQLFVASQLTGEIRKHVFDELGYTCSAGIAHNKVLAKLGSSRNKPNKQTIIRQHIASEFMKDIPFTKIRNLGGKFGQSVGTKYNIKTAGDLWQYALKDLQKDFNESSGLWLYNIIRGIDHEEVILNKAPTSLVASKHFRLPLCNEKDLVPWYPILSAELHTRVMRNWEEHHTWPKTLLIFYQSVSCQCSRSRSTAMALKAQSATSSKRKQKKRYSKK